jgi:hypothetical protein
MHTQYTSRYPTNRCAGYSSACLMTMGSCRHACCGHRTTAQELRLVARSARRASINPSIQASLINHPKQTAKKRPMTCKVGCLPDRQFHLRSAFLFLFALFPARTRFQPLRPSPSTCHGRLETTHFAVESSPATLGEISVSFG